MEEKLVSYEIAKLAHKLGFCEKVMFGIKDSGEHFVGKSVYDWNGDRTTTCYSCPSHCHLYRWIRKFGIYIDTETIIYRGKVAFKIIITYGKCLKCVKVLPKNFDCYEDAWDAGLLYALKLICDGHEHCKHDDCCEERKDDCCEHKHDDCGHDHKHDDCDDDDCKDHCKHDHKDDDDCDKDKCDKDCEHDHDHGHGHEEHDEHHGLHLKSGDNSIDIEHDEHDKKPGKGK